MHSSDTVSLGQAKSCLGSKQAGTYDLLWAISPGPSDIRLSHSDFGRSAPSPALCKTRKVGQATGTRRPHSSCAYRGPKATPQMYWILK